MFAPATFLAPAKLNLCLHITGRRHDGYHLLESVVVFTELADVIHIAPSNELTLQVNGPFAAESGDPANNLALRAACALLVPDTHGKAHGAHITLTKNIPVGAGLGGGSADAAAVLKALSHLWNLHLSDEALIHLAPTIGADVAMCLHSEPLIARGIGEMLTPLPDALPEVFIVLAYPNIAVSSADTYRALHLHHKQIPALTPPENMAHLLHWLAHDTHNDLEAAAISVAPAIAETLHAMRAVEPAPILTRMTGSGSCCFALFTDARDANEYANALTRDNPDWWICETGLFSA